jgi:SAM-dependent methyltransferase
MLAILRNAVDYRLRQLFRWRRRGLQFLNEPKDNLFAPLPAKQRRQADRNAARLLADYRLQFLRDHSPADIYRQNLFYLEMLERAVAASGASLPPSLDAADIGTASWFYVHALHALLKWWQCPAGREVALVGYEADAYRVFADFHSRLDHAQAHVRGLDDVCFVPQPFPRQPAAFDFLTMLFPFVFKKDHLNWGLPRAMFAPQQLLADAWDSLKPGGVMIVVNQGEDEHQAQREMMPTANVHPIAAFRHDSLLFQYSLPRFVLVARRPASGE